MWHFCRRTEYRRRQFHVRRKEVKNSKDLYSRCKPTTAKQRLNYMILNTIVTLTFNPWSKLQSIYIIRPISANGDYEFALVCLSVRLWDCSKHGWTFMDEIVEGSIGLEWDKEQSIRHQGWSGSRSNLYTCYWGFVLNLKWVRYDVFIWSRRRTDRQTGRQMDKCKSRRRYDYKLQLTWLLYTAANGQRGETS